eukprot:gene25179-46149_t
MTAPSASPTMPEASAVASQPVTVPTAGTAPAQWL